MPGRRAGIQGQPSRRSGRGLPLPQICYSTGHKRYAPACIYTAWLMQKSTFSTQLSTETVGKTPVLSGFFGFFHILARPVYYLSTDFGLYRSYFHPIQGLFMANCPFQLRFYVIFTVFDPLHIRFNPVIIIAFLFVYCIFITHLCQFHAVPAA